MTSLYAAKRPMADWEVLQPASYLPLETRLLYVPEYMYPVQGSTEDKRRMQGSTYNLVHGCTCFDMIEHDT